MNLSKFPSLALLLAVILVVTVTPAAAERSSVDCRTVCRSRQSNARAACTRSKFVRNRCRVARCRSTTPGRPHGWECRRRTSTPRPSSAPIPSPISIPRGCRNRCYASRLSAVRDCRFRNRPLEGCAVTNCPHPNKPRKTGWKCAPFAASPFDLNADGTLDNEDLILVLRAILDPLDTAIPPTVKGNADVNADGTVDFEDAKEMLTELIAVNGAASVAPLTVDYNEVHDFNWNQTDLAGSALAVRPLQSMTDRPDFLGVKSRQMKMCGIMAAGDYKKGAGPRPTINWDNGYTFNPSAKATAADYWNWARYAGLATAARIPQPDAARAYFHYRGASGSDLNVDYEKAIREDSVIRSAVDEEIQAVKNAVKEMHDGKEASFSFHSTDSRSVTYVTANWRRALGGHRIWSKGQVTYSENSCELKLDIIIKVEDFYNFNMGQVDTSTGLPDDDNGRFEVLGWARSFFSRGEITRTETIALQCCKDSDCGDETQFDCECNLCTTQCPTQQRSGGQGFTSFTVDLKKTQGTFQVFYQMFSVPDELTIKYEGVTVFGTGGLVSGTRTLPVTYGSGTSTSTVITVELNAPRSGTRWEVSVSCPP